MTTNIYARIPAEAIDIAEANLNKSEFRVWLYLWKVDAFGDKMRVFPSPEKIGEALNLHKRTVSRACDTLEDLGLFTFQVQQWRGINHYGSKSEQAKAKFTQKIQVVPDPDSGCCDSAVQKMTERSNFGQDCQNQGSKVAPEADSNLSNNSLINTGNEIQNETQERDETFGNFSEEADRKFEQEETTVESVATTLKIVQESFNQNDPHKEDSKTETNLKSENNAVDHPSAAAPSDLYHAWISDSHHQKVYDAIMKRSDRPKPPN